MDPKCRFCFIQHQPCDAEYCYCAGPRGGPNLKGEGFNRECEAYWSQLFPGGVQ